MANELAKAYVQIIPTAKGIKGNIEKELGGSGASAGTSIGNNIVGSIGKVVAAAGIGKMIMDSLSAGGDLQQSFGGIDTIYKDAASSVKEYAAEAAKAGISANTYAEQAVSFGASLRQAFGGDMVKSAESANMAIMDMADNSAKMGTDIESIQNAYAGFAKQNYTMLDNLKLGYGGTKSEMERLLADAEKLSGVKYDIDNLGDVYSAIHVVQEELGVAGVAAQEAKSTFTGSFGAMKAAAQNLMANLTLGEDITTELSVLGESIGTFIGGNLLPMVGNLFKGLPQLLNTTIGMAIDGLNFVGDNAESLVQSGVELTTQLAIGLIEGIPQLLLAGKDMIFAIGTALMETDWLQIAEDLINSLKTSLGISATNLLSVDTSIIDSVLTSISNALPGLLNSGIEIITNIANGIFQNIPQLITTAGEIINSLVGFLLENLPLLLQSGFDLIMGLVDGLVSNLPEIATSAIEIIAQLVGTILENLPEILESGIRIIGELAAGLLLAIPDILATIPDIFQSIKNKFGEMDWKSIGSNIIDGLINGLKNGISAIVEAAKEVAESALNAAKDFLDINSPSGEFEDIGMFSDQGLAKGLVKNIGIVKDAMKQVTDAAKAGYSLNLSANSSVNKSGIGTDNSMLYARIDMLIALLDRYLPECAKKQVIDGESMINSINRQLGLAVIQ